MRQKIAQALQKNPVWISLLFHLLLVLIFSLVVTWQPKWEPKPSLEVPAYVYHEAIKPQPQQSVQKNNPTSPTGIEKPVSTKTSVAQNKPQPPVKDTKQNTEGVHLIGDKGTPPKPLVKLLGKALAAHLVYPKVAIDFNLKGIALVGFTLHPDGRVMDARIVKSSGADVLDKAALDGVNAMTPVKDVNLYMQEPRFLVVGIIFSGDEPIGRLMI